jgi:CYTH domain-containing protein
MPTSCSLTIVFVSFQRRGSSSPTVSVSGIDVYKGILSGIILAEVELPSETARLELPHWIGREVTGEAAYKKINMVNARMV